jgi:hypothetical protein
MDGLDVVIAARFVEADGPTFVGHPDGSETQPGRVLFGVTEQSASDAYTTLIGSHDHAKNPR